MLSSSDPAEAGAKTHGGTNLHRQIAIGLLVALMAAVSGACQRTRGDRDSQASPAATGHAVHGQRLTEVMQRIQASTAEDWPQELDAEYASLGPVARQASLDEACRLAAALGEAAAGIPDAVQSMKMPEADRRSFQAQVDTLRDQSQELERAALAGDTAAMQATLDRIGATCASCHARFRDYAGPLTSR
jgi:cytochrome c556